MSNTSAAAETIAELDSMESNLRRLGLGSDTAVDPVHSNSGEATEAYMARIRSTKDERRKLKHEKELRQFMISAKESDNEKYLCRVAEAKRLQTIVDGAPDMLKAENKRAAEVMKARVAQGVEAAQRAEQQRRGQELQRELLVERSKAENLGCALPSASECRQEDLATLSGGSVKSALAVTLHHDDAIDFCETLAHGIVELSLLVSDNRHLPEPDVSGEPVQRLIQDLGVTQWSTWVHQCLHPHDASFGAQDENEAHASSPARTAGSPSSPHPVIDPEEALRDRMVTELRDLAKAHVATVAQQEMVRNDEVGEAAVVEALSVFLQENERVHKVACEAIRREFSEDSQAAAATLATEDGTAAPKSAAGRLMEEVVPRWTQKMPPAATFLHGDDLSGTRLVADKIEQAARHRTNVMQAAHGNADDAAHTSKSAKKVSVPHTPVGVTVRDNGMRTIFVTPRCLTGQLSVSSGAAARAQLGSAGRGRTACKGGATASARRVSNVNGDDDERREMELLSDMLARELLSLHAHNVHAMTAGKMPLPPSTAAAETLASGAFASAPAVGGLATPTTTAAPPAKPGISPTTNTKQHRTSHSATPPPSRVSQAAAAAVQDSASGTTAADSGAESTGTTTEPTTEAWPLQTMVLVGFPESEVFHRLLCDKLRSQMDSMELEMLTEERRLAASVTTEGAVAAANSGVPTGKNKAPHPPSRSKTGKGSSSNLAAQRHLSVANDPLLQSKVFPPLCILGFFLEISVPTRHMRLRDATVRIGPEAGPTPSDAAVPNSEANACASSAQSLSVPVPLSHPVFAPLTASGGAFPSPISSREIVAGGHGRPSTTQSSFSGSVSLPTRAADGVARTSGSAGTSTMLQASMSPVGEVWCTEQMQKELVEQDRRMRTWQETWCSCFPRVSASSLRKVAQGVLKNARRRSGEKGGVAMAAAAMTGASGGGGAAATSPRKASHHSGPGAAAGTGGNSAHNVDNPAGQEAGAAGSSAVTLPKVLFFFRKEDVSDMDPHAELIAKELAETTAWQWLGAGLSGSLRNNSVSLQEHEGTDAAASFTGTAGCGDVEAIQTRWASFLISRVLDTVHSTTRVFTNEALAPQQLPPPLRLSDYRLPREALARLVVTYESYTRHPLSHNNGSHKIQPPQAQRLTAFVPAGAFSTAPSAQHTPATLAAEMDLLRVFSISLAETLDRLRSGVFGSELWQQSTPQHVQSPQKQPTSTVAHYTAIDADYESAKDALLDVTDDGRRRLYARAVVLLRHVIDAALEATADAVTRLSSTLLATCFVSPVAQLECSSSMLSSPSVSVGLGDALFSPVGGRARPPKPHTQSPGMVESSTRTRFLARLRRLSEGDVQALVSPFFVQESAEEAKAALWTTLAPYADEVHACAVEYLVERLEQAEGEYKEALDTFVAAGCAGETSTASASKDVWTRRPRAEWSGVVPTMVARLLAHTFYLRTTAHTNATASAETRGVCTGVSAALVRAVVTVQALVACFDAAAEGSMNWLETMYRIALHVPTGATYPDVCRPPSVASLFSPPSLEAATAGDADMRAWPTAVYNLTCAIAAAEEESLLWHQCRLELLLADIALYNKTMLEEEAFVHCAALHQLRDMCWYTECDSDALAKAVDFTTEEADAVFRDGEEDRWRLLLSRHTDLFLGFTLVGNLGPLAPDTPATIAQIRTSFEQHAEPVLTRGESGDLTWTNAVDIRQWCCDVIRWSATMECQDPSGASGRAVLLSRPSSRELRAVVLTLPYHVVVQAMLASAATDRGESYMTSAAPYSLVAPDNLDATAWLEVQWWGELARLHQSAVAWTLLRALTARYALTCEGVLSTPSPRLPTVLRWLARTACGAHAHQSPASYLEAIYHCLAALQYRLQMEQQAATAAAEAGVDCGDSGVAAAVDPYAVPPLAVDAVVVRAADFAYYVDESGPAMSCATTACLPLATDALLLVQAAGDGATGVTLPLLLSSQWGRSLVQRHNMKNVVSLSPAPVGE